MTSKQTNKQKDLPCVAGAKRRGLGGGRKVRKQGKGKKGPLPSLPNHPPFFPSSLSPTPFDACYAG